jgi:hypothetical protein
VWASLGPIEAESANVAVCRTPCGKLDPELGEKTGACCRDLSRVVVEHDVLAGEEGIGEVDAEAARQVVVANSGRTERGLFWRATATIPSIMSATVGEASRKWRCRPLRITESKPASVNLARWVLAVGG